MGPIRSRKRVAVVAGAIVVTAGAIVIAIAVSGIWSDSVAGDFEYCEPGSGAGQCEQPSGVAIDAESGDVYVADTNNDRIVVYDEVGNPEGAIGAGTLSGPKSIAVDNDPASPTQHDVLVIGDDSRALRFDPAGNLELGIGWGVRDGSAEAQTCGPEATPPTASCLAGISGKGECQLTAESKIAVGPGGTIYVGDSAQEGPGEVFKGRIEKFAPDGTCEEEQVLFEGVSRELRAVAVDSIENVYVAIEGSKPGVQKLDPTGSTLCEFGSKAETSALTIDPSSDNLLAAQTEGKARGGGGYRIIAEYAPEPGCPAARRFGYTEIELRELGLAVFPGIVEPARAGNVLVSEGDDPNNHRVFQLQQPAPGPLIVPGSVIADPISNTKATLGAEINPEGAETEVSIEYVEEAICKADEAKVGGECFEEASSSDPTPLGAEDFSLHGAEALFGCPDPENEAAKLAAGECLKPETSYRFRVLAENADGEGNSPVDGGSFKTLPWILFGATWSTSVGPESALLHAEVNPLGVKVNARFQVIDDAHFIESGFKEAFEVPAPSEAPLDYGKGEEFLLQSASLGGLAPHTTYHYRLVADNPLIEPVIGPERILTTFAPPGFEPCPANEAFRTGPSALLPDCRAYEMVSPLDKGNGDIIPLKGNLSITPAVLVQSSLAGSRFAYGSPRAFGDAPSAPWTSQYIAARGAGGWQSHAISSPIGKPLFESVVPNAESELKALSPDLCEAWLRTIVDPPLTPDGITGFPNIYRRTDDECGGPAYEALTTAEWKTFKPGDGVAFGLELQGLSADGSKAIFLSPDSLVGTGAPSSKEPQLYLWVGGPKPVFACILPGGTALGGSCSGGFANEADLGFSRFAAKQGAISSDGERVFWTADIGPGKIYLRERGEQGKVPKECSAGKPCTIAVSAQGEAKSGTSASQFRAASKDGSRLIFSTDPGGPGGEDLYEAQIKEESGHPALGTTQLIAHGVKGVMGISEDATHVYFASGEAIAKSGKDGFGQEAKAGEANLYLYRGGAYAFIGVLSAQDVNAARSAIAAAPIANLARIAPDGEHAAFLSSASLTGYDNADAASGEPDSEVFRYDAATDRLACASCNPSGARPVGRQNAGKETLIFKGPEWISGWFAGHQTNLYASRELSDDGSRLFFNSTDALIARDTNGRADVYQWEAAGTGGCKTTSSTFSHQNEGCIDLISSGQSAQDSEFLDASPSGADVFFTTLSSLLVQDYGLVDVYDASQGGGFPPPPPPPTECEGEACQSPPPAPVQPTPATSVPAGDGNVAPRCPKGKHKVKRGGKARCVKRHAKKKHHKRHHRRANAKRRAGR
jgi:hypothetical protein